MGKVEEVPQLREFTVENTANFVREGKTEPLKKRDMRVMGLGIPPISRTTTGIPQADSIVIQKLAGNPSKGEYGKAYDHLKEQGKEEEGKRCCEALSEWLQFKGIETLLQTFILPLQ